MYISLQFKAFAGTLSANMQKQRWMFINVAGYLQLCIFFQ